ncbi:MAG: DUF4340 domain-containing protein [Deltaproteobacteria bacterium]|nr:MAG: DUF4340 domain-containing protein [Deltaproteobacteria bacterium]
MNPRTTALLLLAVLGVGAFVYFYEIRGESGRLDAAEREKRLFKGIEPGDVQWIALRTTDGVDARFEQRDGKWLLVAPLEFPADASLERLAEALASVTSEKTFDHPQPDAEYGLDDAAAKIVRFGADGAEHALRIGKATPIGSNVYARTGDAPAVHTIASYHATAFARALSDLRDKQILSFDPSAIGEVEARWPGGRVVLARAAAPADAAKPNAEAPSEAGEWKMTMPLAAQADRDAVDNLLSTLSFLRADVFVDAPTADQRKLLESPDFEVVLKNRDAKQAPLALAIGRPDGERRPVRGGRDVLYEIAAARISDFPRTAVAYRERHLARFLATDAKHVDFFFHVKDGDPVAIRAERTGDAGWTSTPEAFAEGKLAGVVSELSRLEAADILAESMGEKELEKLGLSPPNTIVTVLGAAPAAAVPTEGAAPKEEGAAAKQEGAEEPLPPAAPRLAELHFGNMTPKGVAAQVVGNPIVYRIDLETAERLPVNHDAFESRFRAQPAAPEKAAPAAEPAPEPPQSGEDSP